MKKVIFLIVLSISVLNAYAQQLNSPDGNFQLNFSLSNAGEPVYQLSYKGKEVIKPSRLGLKLKNTTWLTSGFTLKENKLSSVNETWKPVWGEVSQISNHYNEMLVTLEQTIQNRFMKIRFRLFNDGLGFRYEFDRQPELSYFQVQDECTEFALTGDHKTFWIPGDYDTNEYFYTTTKLSEIDAEKVDGTGIGTHGFFAKNAVQSPLMMKTTEGLYINIFEAALLDYSAMHLMVDQKNFVLTAQLAPDATGTKVYMQTPHNSPWRTVIVSDKAADILASKTILNLNEPCKIGNTDFIKPQKFVGIWWGMHVPDHWSWNYSDTPNLKLKNTDWNALKPYGRHGATTENVKRYIDFAAANGIEGVLVEGWNIGWEDWAGNWKEEVFDFVTPYPDFDVKGLQAYAAGKGVKLIMHHETSASVTNYERRIDKAIEFMKENGYDAVKTGYVGWIIPRGEKHDGQWMVNHYQRVIEKMAANRIMIDQHEPVRPTGQHRTYPNLMACEAARGNEFNAWSAGNPPEHETILPFTRLMGGPMDYTPGIFEIKMDYYKPGNTCQVHTTLAKQLALYVTMYSPLQMAADLIENYEKRMDAFQFIKDVAVDWDDTRYLEAEPGDYITIARKAKGTGDWFIGAITDENSRVANIDFSYLEPKTWYVATIYGDAPAAHWKDNPMAYEIRKVLVQNTSRLNQKLAAGGGVAISVKKAGKAEMKGLKKLK
ncbi:MAG: glycoside hydrolase family 97 protein [Bacteroidia bacterium]|nr:glycoside hydrolase family 97 protein [Bacteroidia bacterium]